jgi:hypothetical protein
VVVVPGEPDVIAGWPAIELGIAPGVVREGVPSIGGAREAHSAAAVLLIFAAIVEFHRQNATYRIGHRPLEVLAVASSGLRNDEFPPVV